jgi:sulfite oxidase
MPLNAVICDPAGGAEVGVGPVTVRGYATVSGRTIEQVDLSTDGGAHWCEAALERRPDAPWSWTFWAASIDIAPGEHELVVRAWDSAGKTQPVSAGDIWNFKGYLCTAWHRVRIRAS